MNSEPNRHLDKQRRKELAAEYKNRRPEMGVFSFRCKKSNEAFLGISRDTRTDYNRIFARLSSSCHPNKRLQALWDAYGADEFEYSVLKILKYEDPLEDHTAKLEALREECLAKDPQAVKIWK